MGDTSMSNVSINEEDANNSQLMAIIKYLRQEKEILSGRVELMQAESARIHSQLDHQMQLLRESEAALERERSSQSLSMMSASKHSELIRKVETLSAVTDSNRMLREEKEKVEKENDKLKSTIAETESQKGPMEEKIKQTDEKINTLVVEKLALQSEVDKWKKRSDQLVEKSFKINPKELARLQESETQLTKTVATLEMEKKQVEEKMTLQTKEFDSVKRENTTAKTAHANLQKEINGLKKKTEELVKNHNAEIAKAKKEAEENKAGSDEVNNLKKELEETKTAAQSTATQLEEIKKTLEKKEAEQVTLKSNNAQLKQIGTAMRSKYRAEEKKVKELEEEKQKLEEELKSKQEQQQQDAPSEGGSTATNEGELEEANKLLEASHNRLEEVEAQLEQTKKERDDIAQKFTEKEARAKQVLTTARNRI